MAFVGRFAAMAGRRHSCLRRGLPAAAISDRSRLRAAHTAGEMEGHEGVAHEHDGVPGRSRAYSKAGLRREHAATSRQRSCVAAP
jgi:hypothetical protein